MALNIYMHIFNGIYTNLRKQKLDALQFPADRNAIAISLIAGPLTA
jgi:hypothetical protein